MVRVGCSPWLARTPRRAERSAPSGHDLNRKVCIGDGHAGIDVVEGVEAESRGVTVQAAYCVAMVLRQVSYCASSSPTTRSITLLIPASPLLCSRA
jgi:hypothetical protein